MRYMKTLVTGITACLSLTVSASGDSPRRALDVARVTEEGALIVPENMDEWVFLGSSLGMGYSQADFDPDPREYRRSFG